MENLLKITALILNRLENMPESALNCPSSCLLSKIRFFFRPNLCSGGAIRFRLNTTNRGNYAGTSYIIAHPTIMVPEYGFEYWLFSIYVMVSNFYYYKIVI
jgi:hypothetical protein